MKKIFLLITIAIGFTIAQTDEPTYDDDGRCNTSGATIRLLFFGLENPRIVVNFIQRE